MLTVGIRELRQRASELARQVEAGQTVEVTNHGRPVLRMVPVSPGQDALDRLLAEGKASPAQGDLLEVAPAERRPGWPLLSELLAELRSDER